VSDVDQPDGITDESSLPTTARAAERVNEFLAWYGDGLVYVETGAPPLFARDLQALTNLATGWRSGVQWGWRLAGVEGAVVLPASETTARKQAELDPGTEVVRRPVGEWEVVSRG
jgi:hypothetical protein